MLLFFYTTVNQSKKCPQPEQRNYVINVLVLRTKSIIITNTQHYIRRWVTYFEELLNRSEPENPADEQILHLDENIIENPPCRRWKYAIKALKKNRVTGKDNIPVELFKHGGDTVVRKLGLLIRIDCGRLSLWN